MPEDYALAVTLTLTQTLALIQLCYINCQAKIISSYYFNDGEWEIFIKLFIHTFIYSEKSKRVVLTKVAPALHTQAAKPSLRVCVSYVD